MHMLSAAAVDLLLQVDELANLCIKAWIAWAHAPHARGGIPVATRTRCASCTVCRLPYLATALDPQQARVGKVVVLEALVVCRQIGVARPATLNAVGRWLPSARDVQGQESDTDAGAEPP